MKNLKDLQIKAHGVQDDGWVEFSTPHLPQSFYVYCTDILTHQEWFEAYTYNHRIEGDEYDYDYDYTTEDVISSMLAENAYGVLKESFKKGVVHVLESGNYELI